tara:strand:- start:135 stop:770 length:636 start_codon:yes stop_codon:yes gene_type:complete
MHRLTILIYGPGEFIETINELKPYLKFNLNFFKENSLKLSIKNNDGLIIHNQMIEESISKTLISEVEYFKILATDQNKKDVRFDHILKLPTTIEEINNAAESASARRKFNQNSSINIKSYLLDKNEKKLLKGNEFIILTEKEIQLLDLFLKSKKQISKNDILTSVWNYSSDADTHTVETHIYRLRKKISEKFSDDKFILNNKKGYYLEEEK